MRIRSIAKIVEHAPGLDARELAIGIEFNYVVEVLRPVDADRDIAALAGKTRAASAIEQRRAELARDGDRGDDIIEIPRDDDSDGYLPIIGAVCRVQRAASGIEPHLAAQFVLQVAGERFGVPIPVPNRSRGRSLRAIL